MVNDKRKEHKNFLNGKSSDNSNRIPKRRKEKEGYVSAEGTIIETNGTNFKVELDSGHIVKATISGKMRLNNIRLLVGDKVDLDLSIYDLTRGRIITRLKK